MPCFRVNEASLSNLAVDLFKTVCLVIQFLVIDVSSTVSWPITAKLLCRHAQNIFTSEQIMKTSKKSGTQEKRNYRFYNSGS